MWNNTFMLMNKNKPLITFKSIKKGLGEVDFNIISENDNLRPVGYEDLHSWIESRKAPKHRQHIEELLRVCGCSDLDGFIRVSHALSLNDTFWIKPVDSALKWEDVSLYTNKFSELIAQIAFEGGLYGEGFSSTSPELSTDGTYAKCWIRENDKVYLLKRGTTGAYNAGLEPYSEYYASQVSKYICNSYVDYDLTIHKSALASKCELFTNEKLGFVPISRVFKTKQSPMKLLDYFESIGSADDFRRMLVLDALTLNTDRHMGNFGVLVDNDTQEIIKMAPTFDNNLSLLPYAISDDFDNIDEYIASRPTKIGVDFNETAHWALTPSIKRDLKNLKDFKFTEHHSYNLPPERLKTLEKVIDKQIYNIIHDIHLYVPIDLAKEEQPAFEYKKKEVSQEKNSNEIKEEKDLL